MFCPVKQTGAAEQVNLLYGENPNPSVRRFTSFQQSRHSNSYARPRTERTRMNPVGDVRQLMYGEKGPRCRHYTYFCGLNDVRNIVRPFATQSCRNDCPSRHVHHLLKVHTAEYYINMAEQLIAEGADEICLKDMVNRTPYYARQNWKAIKTASGYSRSISRTHPVFL